MTSTRTARALVAAVALGATLGATGCTSRSNWTEQQLETEGAALIKKQFQADVTVDCPAGLENKQGPSVMCTGSDGQQWLFWANNKGELQVKKGQA